jgi:hypothetical protein
MKKTGEPDGANGVYAFPTDGPVRSSVSPTLIELSESEIFISALRSGCAPAKQAAPRSEVADRRRVFRVISLNLVS